MGCGTYWRCVLFLCGDGICQDSSLHVEGHFVGDVGCCWLIVRCGALSVKYSVFGCCVGCILCARGW